MRILRNTDGFFDELDNGRGFEWFGAKRWNKKAAESSLAKVDLSHHSSASQLRTLNLRLLLVMLSTWRFLD